MKLILFVSYTLKALKNWVFTKEIAHFVSPHFTHHCTEERHLLFGFVIRRKRSTTLYDR